jgi:acetyl-CoA carboxylase, carboxyl transferase, alpha subunit
MAQNLKAAVVEEFKRIDKYSLRELLRKRYEKYRRIGDFFEE